MVNRIWQFRMGTGLVATPNDFGLLGGDPTRSQTARLAGSGVHGARLERQAHRPADPALGGVPAVDASTPLTRSIREQAVLAHEPAAAGCREPSAIPCWPLSGMLNPKIGGPPVRVPIEKEVYDLIFTEGEPDNLWPLSPDKSRTVSPQPLPAEQADRAAADAGEFRSAGRHDFLPGAARSARTRCRRCR